MHLQLDAMIQDKLIPFIAKSMGKRNNTQKRKK